MNDKSQFRVFLGSTFAIAWLLQALAVVMLNGGHSQIYQIILMIMMFAPTIALIICKRGFRGLGFQPQLKKNWKYLLMAWFVPGILAAIGAGIFFLVFPNAFDLTGEYLVSVGGADILTTLAEQGYSLQKYLIVTVVSSFTYAPIMNMFFAAGEELGWRGYMYPVLKEKYGKLKGRIIGGIIWSIWHWPIMYFGYEYGTTYIGYPFLGPVVFLVLTISVGIFLDWLYEKTHCFWAPALAHGAVNGATFGLMFVKSSYLNQLIVGPTVVGIIGMIPFVVVAILISLKSKEVK